MIATLSPHDVKYPNQRKYRQSEKGRAKVNDLSLKAYHRRGGKEIYAKLKGTPEGWVRWALSSARQRAKKDGMAFTVTPADIVWVPACPVLGVPFVLGTGQRRDDGPSLDRVDSTKGYVPGNVRVISWKANRLKGSNTAETLRQLLTYTES